MSFSLRCVHCVHSYPHRVVKKVPELVANASSRLSAALRLVHFPCINSWCPQSHHHCLHSHRVIKKVPELVESFIERAANLLNDKNQGVMLTGATLMLQV